MHFKEIVIENVPLLVPYGSRDLPDTLESFPDACGPGQGIGELVVPEKLLGLRVTPACWIHDLSWSVARPFYDDYVQSNSVFLANMVSLIEYAPCIFFKRILKPVRFLLAISYYKAVSSDTGQHIFWSLKYEQERERRKREAP